MQVLTQDKEQKTVPRNNSSAGRWNVSEPVRSAWPRSATGQGVFWRMASIARTGRSSDMTSNGAGFIEDMASKLVRDSAWPRSRSRA